MSIFFAKINHIMYVRFDIVIWQYFDGIPWKRCIERPWLQQLYSCNRITTTWIQISRQNWNGFFSNAKGQLILKAICQAEDSSKKWTTEFVFTSKWRVFVRFFEESSARKKRFEIIWPLEITNFTFFLF